MTRDYAKKRKPRRQTRRQGAPGWLWLAAGLAVGLFIAFLVWLGGREGGDALATLKAKLPERQETRKPAPTPKKPAPAPEEKGVRYEFYDILPEYEVPVPDSGETREKQPPARAPKALEPGKYLLQVGSFRKAEDAERRKAELALLGIVSSIQKVTINEHDTWHRVRIGPYSDLEKLQSVRELLGRNGIDFMVFREKG